MTKGELIKYLEPFTDEIDFLVPYKEGLDYCGILEAEYLVDNSGTGHIVLVPAIELGISRLDYKVG